MSLTVHTGRQTRSVRERTTPSLPDVDMTSSPDQTVATKADAETKPTPSSAKATLPQAAFPKTVNYVNSNEQFGQQAAATAILQLPQPELAP